MNEMQTLFMLVVQTHALRRDVTHDRDIAAQVVGEAPYEKAPRGVLDKVAIVRRALQYVEYCYNPDHLKGGHSVPPKLPEWMA